MNKQELIERIEKMPYDNGILMDFVKLNRGWLLRTIEQLEPEKVIIPQFVADWIEYCKVKKITLAHALYRSEEAENKSVFSWIVEGSDNQEAFARAWLDGYEVEEEKRYVVKIKGNIKENMLVYGELSERYFFVKSLSLDNVIYSHARKELEEAGFSWVFDCPGIEIEEVE